MKAYKDYNDYQLLDLICEADEEAHMILYNKYRPIIINKAQHLHRQFDYLGLEIDDFIQEGMIGLSEAIRDFKYNKDAKFSTFANLCINREMLSAITKANRKKHKNLNEAMSLDYVNSITEKKFSEIVKDPKNLNPEEYLIINETKKEILKKINEELTDYELEIFNLKQEGYSYQKIASKLGKNIKSIDNALQRIKTKIDKLKESV